MKLSNRLIIILIIIAFLVAFTKLQGQSSVEMESEFNISVELYRSAEISDNWACYQTYNGLILMALDESGNFQDTLFFRQPDIKSYGISDNILIYSENFNEIALISNFHVYDISEGIPVLISEFSLNGGNTFIECFDSYYLISYSTTNHKYTNVYDINTNQLINSYVDLKMIDKVNETTMLVDDAETNQRNIYQLNAEGELTLLYTFDNVYYTGQIHDNLLLLQDLEKIDFYQLSSDSLDYLGSINLVNEFLSPLGFYYQNGVLGYNRYQYQEYFYFELLDVTDLDNPILIHSLDYLTITDPDEISTVFNIDMTVQNNHIYSSLSNKPLIHLKVEDNVTSYLEMVQGYRSPTKFNLIREDKFFTNDLYDIVSIDISNASNPVNVENNYLQGYYIWFEGDEVTYCTRISLTLEAIIFYSLDDNDNLTYIDSLCVDNFNPHIPSRPLSYDGANLIYSDATGVKSLTRTASDWQLNWELDRPLGIVSDLAIVNDCLYISDWGRQYLDIYQFDDSSIEYLGETHIGDYTPMYLKLDEDKEFLAIPGGYSGKVFDLREDYSGLSSLLNLNLTSLQSNVTKANDLLMFVGKTSYSSNIASDQDLCIFRETADGFVYEDSIELDFSYTSIKLFASQEGNLKIVLTGLYGTAIYTGNITPNGHLEVNPVPLSVNNYPNPFNPETTISYDLTRRGDVQLDVFNLKGQKVKTLVNEVQESGNHKTTWHGDNQAGNKVSSGTYFYKLKANGKEEMRKMTLVK